MVSQINGSVVKAFRILSLFEGGLEEISAADVSERLAMNGVTAHRFLRTLEMTGALVAAAKGRYRLGFALVDLGERAAGHVSIANVVQPVLDDLSRTLMEGSMATVFDGEMVVCIAKAAPDKPLFVDVRRGSRLEAYCTAHGKLWLSTLGPVQLARYFDIVERRALTGTTLVSREALTRDLDEIRSAGIAFNEGEREEHIHGAAVPVRTRGGRMVCGLSLFGPPGRFTGEARLEIAAALRLAAKEAERLLYGQPGDGDLLLDDDDEPSADTSRAA